MNRKPLDPQRRTQALFRKLEKLPKQIAAKPTPEAVHQVRTTVRRIETLVTTTGSDAEGTAKLLKQLKHLRRRAGKLRDIDVQMVALRSLRVGGKRDKIEVRHALERVHEKQSRKLIAAIEEELRAGLDKRLKRTAAVLSQMPEAAQAHAGALGAALDKFAALEKRPPLTAETLHDFRMDVKRIRYHAEMEGDTPDVQAALKQFKRIQDAIGEWHDWVNLAQTAEDVVTNDHSPLLAAIRAGRQAKFNESLRITADAKRQLLRLRSESKPGPAASPTEPAASKARWAVAS